MFCSKCGYENLNDSNFCERCGSRLSHINVSIKPVVRKRSHKKLIVIIVVSAILLIAAVVVAVSLILSPNSNAGSDENSKELQRSQTSTSSTAISTSTSAASNSTQISSTEKSSQNNVSYPTVKFSLDYIDVSDYFSASDTLTAIADGQIINATKVNDYEPYKSVFLSDDYYFTELDEVFHSGIYDAETGTPANNQTPELVHNNGTHHVYKATSNGTELIKTSQYPMYVTDDGYIAYYSSRSNSSVTVDIQSPGGKIISSTTIDGYSDPMNWIYGSVIDRLSVSGSRYSYLDTKGAAFSYYLYCEQARNTVTGYYDTKYVQYLFYTNGDVVLDETLVKAKVGEMLEIPPCPEELVHAGRKYLRSDIIIPLENNIEIVEYYDSNYIPVEQIDGYYIEPEYSAYMLVNKKNGKYLHLYKEISAADANLFIAADFDGKTCYLDKNGYEVSEKYEDVGAFDGKYSFVLENGEYYLINRDFEKLIKIDGTNIKVVGNDMFSCVRNQKLYMFTVA